MSILNIFQRRSTAQAFDGHPVNPEIINRILEVGRLAPSAKNRQTWRFIVVRQPKTKEALTQACFGDERILKAGCIIAACTTNIQYTMPNGQPSHPMDIAFAVSYMALQATHEGLGSVILGTYDEQAVKKLLFVPNTMQVVLLLAVGYSVDKNKYVDRLPLDRVISYEHW